MPMPAEKHVLILEPKEETEENPEAIKHKLLQHIHPGREKLKVKSVYALKSKQVVMDLQSVADVEKIMKNQAVKESYKFSKPKKRNPLVIIYDVDSAMTEKRLVRRLAEQNECDEAGITPRFKTGPKDKPTCHWVVEGHRRVTNSG